MTSGPLIDRTRELEQLGSILTRRTPALVLIGAEGGMGKSRLLQELEERAASGTIAGAGTWSVAYRDDEGELAITPSTAPETFLERLGELVGVRTRPGVGRSSGSIPLVPSPPTLPAEISRRAPLLILIDSYQPRHDFSAWFEGWFIAQVREGADSVIIVIATLLSNLFALEERTKPDLVIRLGPIPQEAVRGHLLSMASLIEPPLSEDEIARYTKAASEDPTVLHALTRVLALRPDRESGVREVTVDHV
jgi:hypothetical protein